MIYMIYIIINDYDIYDDIIYDNHLASYVKYKRTDQCTVTVANVSIFDNCTQIRITVDVEYRAFYAKNWLT